MLLPLSWLKEYVDVKLSCDKLIELLTSAGMEVEAVLDQGGDNVLEIEVTPNRPDWLSIVGLAREVAVISGVKLKFKPPVVNQVIKTKNEFSILIEDKKDCSLYSARLIKNCNVKESPAKMIKRLESAGLRAVNNVVDITNFCLFETGQPLHAFDYDKLEGNKIEVRRARNGEEITTIDGIKHKLDSRILVIADSKRPVTIAGIMGGKDTEVTESTKNVLLESASFDAVLIRRSSRMLGISSESSYRFERKVDFDNVIPASNRASVLIEESARGKIAELKSVQQKRKTANVINLSIQSANNILGVALKPSNIKKFFDGLGFKVVVSGKDGLKITPPSFRTDVTMQEDLLEEIARHHGYDKIPARLPLVKPYLSEEPRNNLRWLNNKARQVLTAQGLFEAITYSLINENVLKALSLNSAAVRIANPLSKEQEFMRPMILPGLLSVVKHNYNRQEADINIFETGKVYNFSKSISETTNLAVCISGKLLSNWQNKEYKADLFKLKGIIQNLFDSLGITEMDCVKRRQVFLDDPCSLAIIIAGQTVGFIGRVNRNILSSYFDVQKDVYAAEINLDKILPLVQLDVQFKPLPKFPSSLRALSLVVKQQEKYADIVGVMKAEGGNELKKIEFVDEYKGKQIADGYKSLTFSLTFQSADSTLTDDEVNIIQERILSSLKIKCDAKLRAIN